MKIGLDATHDPKTQSWVESANDFASEFPIQNLPFGVFRREGTPPRIGVAIGDRVLDLGGMWVEGLLAKGLPAEHSKAAEACSSHHLNDLMALGADPRRALRRHIHSIMRDDAPPAEREAAARHLIPQSAVEMLLPATVGDYTDFYASVFHATNVGKLFRPDQPLLPNYKYVPIGYHGRASSIVPSGTPIRRPCGQTRDAGTDPSRPPDFGPTRSLDYELEVGFFVGAPNELGEPIPIARADEHIFGICLVNDWSARDLQSWEYQPLGPFLAKSFATSISPWVVTMDALAPFSVAALARPADDPQPLPYLFDHRDQEHGGLDLHLEVSLLSPQMRAAGYSPAVLGRGNFCGMYWTMAQMLAHHASNGCNLRAADLLASGTVSGREEKACGCMLELTQSGDKPFALPTGERRTFLEDGDEVILRGYCDRQGFRRIGTGTCRGTVLPAANWPANYGSLRS